MGGKLDPVFTGPYTVAEILDKGRYSLLNADGKKLKKLYNGVLLKEYVEPKSQYHIPNLPSACIEIQHQKEIFW